MTARRVTYNKVATAQLARLYRFIARRSSPDVARRYIGEVVAYCDSLVTFPNRGIQRDDIRPGLRLTHHRGQTVIGFTVEEGVVGILGIFHGGQQFEVVLRTTLDLE